MSVGDHEPDPAESAVFQRAQEPGPERFVFAVTDIAAQHFAATGSGDPCRDDNRSGHDLAQRVVADVHVGGVEIQVGERHVAEGPVPERVDAFVEARADP